MTQLWNYISISKKQSIRIETYLCILEKRIYNNYVKMKSGGGTITILLDKNIKYEYVDTESN